MPRRRIELTQVDHLLDELLEGASTPKKFWESKAYSSN